MWKGVVIEESLEDKSLLELVNVVKTKVSTLEGEEEKGEWHFHTVHVADESVADFVEKAKTAIRQRWWTHLVNGDKAVVVLRDRAFSHMRGDTTIKEIRDYVASQGILQLPDDEMLFDASYD